MNAIQHRVLTEEETSDTFESWRNQLIACLSQTSSFAAFLKPGATWPKKRNALVFRGYTGADAASKAALLDIMLCHIANLVPVLSRHSITKNSTSLDCIWEAIRQYYGIQAHRARDPDVSAQPSPSTSHAREPVHRTMAAAAAHDDEYALSKSHEDHHRDDPEGHRRIAVHHPDYDHHRFRQSSGINPMRMRTQSALNVLMSTGDESEDTEADDDNTDNEDDDNDNYYLNEDDYCDYNRIDDDNDSSIGDGKDTSIYDGNDNMIEDVNDNMIDDGNDNMIDDGNDNMIDNGNYKNDDGNDNRIDDGNDNRIDNGNDNNDDGNDNRIEDGDDNRKDGDDNRKDDGNYNRKDDGDDNRKDGDDNRKDDGDDNRKDDGDDNRSEDGDDNRKDGDDNRKDDGDDNRKDDGNYNMDEDINNYNRKDNDDCLIDDCKFYNRNNHADYIENYYEAYEYNQDSGDNENDAGDHELMSDPSHVSHSIAHEKCAATAVNYVVIEIMRIYSSQAPMTVPAVADPCSTPAPCDHTNIATDVPRADGEAHGAVQTSGNSGANPLLHWQESREMSSPTQSVVPKHRAHSEPRRKERRAKHSNFCDLHTIVYCCIGCAPITHYNHLTPKTAFLAQQDNVRAERSVSRLSSEHRHNREPPPWR
jgi:hypothetical protein